MAAAEWTRANPGPFVDSEGAAKILGVSVQYVGRLAAQGRLLWLPTGQSGGEPDAGVSAGANRSHCTGA